MTDSLDTLSDQALNELFAVEVAQYVLYTERRQPPMSTLETPERWCYRDREGNFYLGEPYPLHADAFKEIGLRHGYMWGRPKFCTDANAVLPWLEKRVVRINRYGASCGDDPEWQAVIDESRVWFGVAKTFPRAAVLALLRATRASKEQP